MALAIIRNLLSLLFYGAACCNNKQIHLLTVFSLWYYFIFEIICGQQSSKSRSYDGFSSCTISLSSLGLQVTLFLYKSSIHLQTRIVLNKADTVKPEELMRVQSALIWNISPLMSSAQPPVMYTVSLWSMPYEPGAPVRLLHAQERELLRDLRQAIDKRIENKIASARRFAVSIWRLQFMNAKTLVSI